MHTHFSFYPPQQSDPPKGVTKVSKIPGYTTSVNTTQLNIDKTASQPTWASMANSNLKHSRLIEQEKENLENAEINFFEKIDNFMKNKYKWDGYVTNPGEIEATRKVDFNFGLPTNHIISYWPTSKDGSEIDKKNTEVLGYYRNWDEFENAKSKHNDALSKYNQVKFSQQDYDKINAQKLYDTHLKMAEQQLEIATKALEEKKDTTKTAYFIRGPYNDDGKEYGIKFDAEGKAEYFEIDVKTANVEDVIAYMGF